MSSKYCQAISGSREWKLSSKSGSVFGLMFALSTLLVTGCSSDNETMTESGYAFEMIVDEEGVTGNPGDHVFVHMRMTSGDEVVFDTRENPTPPEPVRLPPVNHNVRGYILPILEVVGMMSIGDSARLEIPVDSIQPTPPPLEQYEMVVYDFKVYDIKDDEGYREWLTEMRSAMEAEQAEVKARVDVLYSDYKAGVLDDQMKEAGSGLRYVLLEEGRGPVAGVGELVSARYYGILDEDGAMFDTSWKSGRAYTFELGKGEVIAGWDIGFAQLNTDAKAMLFIPSELAYGERGYPPTIAPGADLIFYVEVAGIN